MSHPTSRALLASVAVAVLFAPAAWADSDKDFIDRYHLIPDVQIQGKAGKRQGKAILLDSATGRTWFLGSDKNGGPMWSPIEMKREEVATSSKDGKKGKVQRSFAPDPPKRKTPRQSIWDYERDP